MNDLAIGVIVHTEPEQLAGTLDTLHANTPLPFNLLLLPDGPDAPTKHALNTRWTHIRQLTTDATQGGAACLNRLIQGTDADILLLLESGTRFAPGWLERLLEALNSNSRFGLAGPSTNHCWNEQAAFPNATASLDALARISQEALRRFGATHRTLEPLHSLNDFCYLVRRQVADAIGPADEAYGVGPCWEMDYNIRAARAGFLGVWACASFVYRAPMTERRRRNEALLFEANKRRYQDKFCGLRLQGLKSDYRSHCRGDACPNFAPKLTVITPQISVAPGAEAEHSELPAKAGPQREAAALARPKESETVAKGLDCSVSPGMGRLQIGQQAASLPHGHPLVSCIMPTADRRSFIPRAIRLFLQQDYPNLELIVIDDGADPVSDLMPSDPRVRYEHLTPKARVGAKRNLACSRATGEIVVHWDDDDWYPPNRISWQVDALLTNNADVCGTSVLYFCDFDQHRSFRYKYTGPQTWVAGNTLAYRKSYWQANRFPDIQVGEDCRFLWSKPRAAIHDLNDPSLCVATIHQNNVSPKQTSPPYWIPEDHGRIAELLGVDFPTAPAPLISCIMPTWNRRAFVPLALRWFAGQTYPNKELIIVDDGTEPVADLASAAPDARYIRLERKATIGAKRNLACRNARGSIIAHWDDDDWYAPGRLQAQAQPILEGRADITGLVSRYILELPSGQCWTTNASLHRRMFIGDVHGGTLVYSRLLVDDGTRYPEANLAEDAMFLRQALTRKRRLVQVENPDLFVYLRHARNAWTFSSGNFLDPAGWKPSARPPQFSDELLECYRTAALSIS